MKLIFEYTWGDMCCYGREIFPVEYVSKDDLILDFQIACEEAMANSKEIQFFDRRALDPSDFMDRVLVKKGNKSGKEEYKWEYRGPIISTLEEWLQRETAYKITTEDKIK